MTRGVPQPAVSCIVFTVHVGILRGESVLLSAGDGDGLLRAAFRDGILHGNVLLP